ncbi:OLC1v1019531C1 [Oldenlandia corymbosa var. corymbosa]|uniref:OLC1v1019531C1 n=1 Tax=Oldenlandia corymbosa var. corymbosa TaxID=529605 RepID=A0AAV1EED5_OLDCO|nr:OLC1v1019531C1 [Oldenlandia corymbosa var. corymbosa]
MHSGSFSSNTQLLIFNDAGVTLAKPIMVEKMNGGENCVFSPLSLNIILSFIAAGALGATKDQLLSFLNSKSVEELNSLASQLVTDVLVDGASVACHLSMEPGLINLFLLSPVSRISFNSSGLRNKPDEARIEVNSWAENQTNGLIKDLIPKGPYEARRFSLYLYLPDDYKGLPNLVERISRQPRFVESDLPHRPVPVCYFFIPKFEISYDMEASDILKQLGLVLPFDEEKADFADMVNVKLLVSKIFHKSFIEVNQKGTKAAAAMAAIMPEPMGCSALPIPEPKVDFVADHPFFFLIREDVNGSVLFMGTIVNPVSH